MSIQSLLDVRPTLSSGSRHPDVRDLQRRLNQQGAPIPISGLFDHGTELAVKSFQSKVFLTPDGVVGPKTWQALYLGGPGEQPVLQLGDHGVDVTRLQELLSIDLYYQGAVDGIYASQTEEAVRKFQLDWGLDVDGIVDHFVWQCLSNV